MTKSFLQRQYERSRSGGLTSWLILTLNASVATPRRHVDPVTVDRNFLELRVLCSTAGLPDPKLNVVSIPNATPAFLATLWLNKSKLCTYPKIFSTAEAAMNHIVLEGIVSITGQQTNLQLTPNDKLNNSVSLNGDESVSNVVVGREKPAKLSRNDISMRQKPLEGWIQDITTGAWDGEDDSEEEAVGTFEYNGNGAVTVVENSDFVYRQRGFKRIKLINYEADGHVIVQVLESSFTLFERAEFKYDETKPATEFRGNHYYFAKVPLDDGTVYGSRAEYRGEASDSGHVLMYFSDIGQTVSVRKTHIHEIENYLDAVKLPPQAVKVSVAGVTNMGYSVEQLDATFKQWISPGETYFMMRVKPWRKEKYIERSTGVPKVLIMNREGRVLGVWKR